MVGEECWAGESMIVEVKCVNVPEDHVVLVLCPKKVKKVGPKYSRLYRRRI